MASQGCTAVLPIFRPSRSLVVAERSSPLWSSRTAHGMVRAVCVNALVLSLRGISDGRPTATTILPFVCKAPAKPARNPLRRKPVRPDGGNTGEIPNPFLGSLSSLRDLG
jgi:hypothetical protein